MKILFPRDTGQRYYRAHYAYLLNILKFMNLDVELYEQEFRSVEGFILKVNGKRVLVDFWNFLKLVEDTDDFDTCFKYHYSKEHCGQKKNVYPIGIISFYDWKQYFELESSIKYNCYTDRILSNQKARMGAKVRRLYVQSMLREMYGHSLDIEITDVVAFWMKINSCLVSVCVPGQRNDILDRGQFQYMAFGACTISPRLNIILPYMKFLEPGVHYIECTEDYSDLIEKIEWCKGNREMCIQIGQNAKKLFSETSTPSAIWTWMEGIITKEITL